MGKYGPEKTLYFTKCLPLQNMRNEYNICQYCMRLMCDNPFISSTCSLFNLFEKKTMFKHETFFRASEISKQATCWHWSIFQNLRNLYFRTQPKIPRSSPPWYFQWLFNCCRTIFLLAGFFHYDSFFRANICE